MGLWCLPQFQCSIRACTLHSCPKIVPIDHQSRANCKRSSEVAVDSIVSSSTVRSAFSCVSMIFFHHRAPCRCLLSSYVTTAMSDVNVPSVLTITRPRLRSLVQSNMVIVTAMFRTLATTNSLQSVSSLPSDSTNSSIVHCGHVLFPLANHWWICSLQKMCLHG